MTQQELERSVSEATGEDLREIRRRGFSCADPEIVDFDPEPNDLPPSLLDWDEVDLLRHTHNAWGRHEPATV